jgi:tetratricopeptide (TPR) repeat protein
MAAIAAALLVTFAVYFPGLAGPLLLDDIPQLSGLIEHSADTPRTLIDSYIISSSGPFGRPVAMASFIADAIAHGDDIWWWKHTNLMLHLVAGLLVLWLTLYILKALRLPDGDQITRLAIVAAALWMLHPLHVSTVLYTVQRMTELSTVFVLAGLLCYIAGRCRQISGAANGWYLIVVGFALFFPLALFSKESGLLFPVYCSLIEVLILRFGGSPSLGRQVKALHYTLFVCYSLAGVYLLANVNGMLLDSYLARDFTLLERVLSEPRIVVLYILQLLRPVQSAMGFFHDDVLVSTSLFDPITTLLSVLLLLALIASAVIMRKRSPLYAFGVLFFLASHLLESTVFALELMFEHRNYLASYGIVLAVIAIAQIAISSQRVKIIGFCVVIVGLSVLTWQRAITWASPVTLYEFSYYAHPKSPRLNYLFATVFTDMQEYDRAREFLGQIDSGVGPRVHRLYLDCLQNGTVDDNAMAAIQHLPSGLSDAHVIASIDILTPAILNRQCAVSHQSFIEMVDYLLTLRTRKALDTQDLMFAKAHILVMEGKIDEALLVFRSALELRPKDAMPLYLATIALANSGRLEEAKKELSSAQSIEQIVGLDKTDLVSDIYLTLASELVASGRYDSGLEVYAQAIDALPGEAVFYLEMTGLLIQLQRYDIARKVFAGVRELREEDLFEYQYTVRILERALVAGYRSP